MDAMAWLWAGALSVVAFWLGWRTATRWSVRCFGILLLRYGLWDAYKAASDAYRERNP